MDALRVRWSPGCCQAVAADTTVGQHAIVIAAGQHACVGSSG